MIKRNSLFFLIGAVSACYVVSALVNLGCFNLTGEEPRRALVAIEMVESGNYIVPTDMGLNYYNKPPVYSWILSGVISAFGSATEFVLRLPSLLFLLCWAFFHYHICKRYFSKTASALSAFFMLTSADLYFYFLPVGAEIDVFYSFVVYLQVVSVFLFYEQKRWWSLFVLSWFFCAVGFLTKGFPSLFFQGLTLVALCFHARSVKLIFKPQQFAGFLVFLFITGLYFYIYNKQNSAEAFLVNLVNETLKKSAIGEQSTGQLGKTLFYPVVLIRLLAPWILFLLLLFSRQRFRFKENPLVWFSILFILFNLPIYWISGTPKIRYIYMFIPFAMNIFVFLYATFEERNPGWLNRYLQYGALLFVVFLAGIITLPFFVEVSTWWTIVFAVLTVLFLFLYIRATTNRIWWFIMGVILMRLFYGVVIIPLRAERAFDYKPAMKAIVSKAGNNEVRYWHPTDTLQLNIHIGRLLYKWKGNRIVVPGYVYRQVPYYYYYYSGKVLKLDTSLRVGPSYLGYSNYMDIKEMERISSIYEGKARDSLFLFRLRKP